MKNLYAVYDRVSDHWNDVISCGNDAEAVRGFVHSCSNLSIPENFLKDIAIYRIGVFDECTGVICDADQKLIMVGDDYNIISNRDYIFKKMRGFTDEISEKESDT